MKEAKKGKVQITEQICRQVQLMRKGGANQTQVAELLRINSSTVSRLEAAGFDLQTYTENRKIRRERERKRNQPAVTLTISAEELRATEEQVPGQMEMDLTRVEKPEMSDQTKMMRFQAHQADEIMKKMDECTVQICAKLDRLNDTLSMILRAVRKE